VIETDHGDKLMIDQNPTDDAPFRDRSCVILAALADGERVDPSELRIALEDPAAREYLVDVIALRQAVAEIPATSATVVQERRPRVRHSDWLAAAAAVVISLTAGYFAGQRTAAQTLSGPMIETAVDLGDAAIAPKPTHVVPLRPGVNWTETIGGQ
jgi:hypothetical protein